MNMYKRFKKFDFFSALEVSMIHFVANRTSIRNKAGYRASEFTDLVTTTITGRPYGCLSSITTIINNALREFVVREMATRYRDSSDGKPYIYVFGYAIVKAISLKLKEMENFGTSSENQAILLLVNEHKENFKPFTKEEAKKITTLAKTVLEKEEYFTKSEVGEGENFSIVYTPTELAYFYYNRWVELIQIYSVQ